MPLKMYDLAIIGAGWAGLSAARKARELGLRVALIEKQELGGTCLNRGCIPSKSLLQSAKIYLIAKKAKTFGVTVENPTFSLAEIQARKDRLVQGLRQAIEFSLKGITIFRQEARLLSESSLKLGDQQIEANAILIATGSRTLDLPQLRLDGKKIISSDDLLRLKEIPRSLLIVGAGAIGCEFASLFSALGTQVSIIEKMPQILPGIDNDVARRLESILKKKGIKVSVNNDAKTVSPDAYDLVLVSVGRSPQTQGLGLEELGVPLERGRIITDEYLRTNLMNIYAAGDCTAKVMLAHFAGYQGQLVAENLAQPKQMRKCSTANIPNCIFTEPEIAAVGLTEEQAATQGLKINIHKFDFLGSGMARILEETEGFMKIISQADTAKLLGACIIGPRATELISCLAVAIGNGLTIPDIKNTIFAHPSLSEAIQEAII